MAKNIYDAIVVGTRHSGGRAAKEFCKEGLKTLVPQRGRNVEPIRDYTDTNKAPGSLNTAGIIKQE